MSSTVKQFLSLEDVAESTGLSVRTLRRRIAEGKLPAYRAGRAIRVKREDIDTLFTPMHAWEEGVA